jgi:DNA-binding transcriptional ArsR family regulator
VSAGERVNAYLRNAPKPDLDSTLWCHRPVLVVLDSGSGHGVLWARSTPYPLPGSMMLERSKRIARAQQRLVMCRLLVDIMRTLRAHYMPVNEPFGTRIETQFVGLCVAIGDIEGKPFSVAKIAAYMGMSRSTVIRRLEQLENWGVIERQGRRYFIRPEKVNGIMGMRAYKQNRHLTTEAVDKLSVLDTLPDYP